MGHWVLGRNQGHWRRQAASLARTTDVQAGSQGQLARCAVVGTRQDDEDREGELNQMNTPRAALHIAAEPAGGGEKSSAAMHDPDPLRRLEAELQRASGERPDGERLHEQAWSLLEEAWGLVTECLVLRDGLLDACHEIEQTMEGIQQRLEGLPAAAEPNAQERLAAGGQDAVGVSGDAAVS
jgi:hypothetical protein